LERVGGYDIRGKERESGIQRRPTIGRKGKRGAEKRPLDSQKKREGGGKVILKGLWRRGRTLPERSSYGVGLADHSQKNGSRNLSRHRTKGPLLRGLKWQRPELLISF